MGLLSSLEVYLFQLHVLELDEKPEKKNAEKTFFPHESNAFLAPWTLLDLVTHP